MDNIKKFRSVNYNMSFDKDTGAMARWGTTMDEDPEWCPFGPEILDIEISAGGSCLGNCPFCYKANGGGGPTHNMTIQQFKDILGKFNLDVLTQMALGIMDIGTNPDFFAMMQYAREKGVIPNYTTHGLDMTPMFARLSKETCGVVAVSVVDKDYTYRAIEMLTNAGMRQVNMHYMLSEESYDEAFKIMEDIQDDPRLQKLHALVFLQYKKKGRGIGTYKTIQHVKKYQDLLDAAEKLNVPIGFDSCSAPMYLKVLDGKTNGGMLSIFAEPCESGLFSSYINCKGEFFPCSFMEGQEGWESGINVLEVENFTSDIWNHERTKVWRKKLLGPKPKSCSSCSLSKSCRICPEYTELKCK